MNKEMDVLSLLEILEKKNSYLLEFHKINLDEIKKLNDGSLDSLEDFYYSREILLNAIDQLDQAISEKENKEVSVNEKEKKKLEDILKFKKDVVLSILDQDITIMSLVEKLNDKKISMAS